VNASRIWANIEGDCLDKVCGAIFEAQPLVHDRLIVDDGHGPKLCRIIARQWRDQGGPEHRLWLLVTEVEL